MLGIKYPQPKPSAESASEQLRPDSYGSRAPSQHQNSSARTPTGVGLRRNISTAPPGLLREPDSASDISCSTAPPGLLREPGSASDIDCSTAPPRLLREPGSVHDFCSKEDSAQTLTGAGFRPRFLQQGRPHPDSYGSRAPSTTSTARKTPSGLLQEPGFAHDFNRKEDSARTPTGARLRT